MNLSLVTLMFFLLLLSCSTGQKAEEKSWPQNMDSLGIALNELMPYIFEEAKFKSTTDNRVIKDKIEKFAEAVHSVSPKEAESILGNDPLVQLNLRDLKKDAQSALYSYEKENFEYSRSLLKNSLNSCFACHTRSDFGPEYDLELNSISNSNLRPEERVQFFVATRQFEKAKKYIKDSLITEQRKYTHAFDKENIIKYFLIISLRVEESPQEAYQFLTSLSGKMGLPYYLSSNLESWKKSLLDWKAGERNNKKISDFEYAKTLVNRSNIFDDLVRSRDKYVDYLRASLIFHRELRNQPQDQVAAEIYYNLGIIYNYMNDPGLWGLPENYFESCIRRWPKSSLAKDCFKNYEMNIFIGYSGSAGTYLPPSESIKLKVLQELAGL